MRIPSLVTALLAGSSILILSACSEESQVTDTPPTVENTATEAADSNSAETSDGEMSETTDSEASNGGAATGSISRNAYFGDLHVHTKLSFDAFIFGTRTDPDAAYRFAKGETIKHPAGFDLTVTEPLDFQAVTDHGVFLGMLPAMFDETTTVGQHPSSVALREAKNAQEILTLFRGIRKYWAPGPENDLLDPAIIKSAWQDVVSAAEKHNDPGNFTTFIAYEYTSSGPESENLHRNVIFKGSAAPEVPFSRVDSTNPEKLWDWMDELRGEGIEALAIPHNSNGSNGMMFQLTNWAGDPMDDAYAEQRMRNEPIVEVTQVKGTSDTHPALSPNDEWADFEIMDVRVATDIPSKAEGSYVREAYLNGLAMEQEKGVNPYKFGLVGASDTHVSGGSFDESNYWSKVGLVDATPQQRGSVPLDEPGPNGEIYNAANGVTFHTWSASGLTGVWAEENTREAIYDAFRRKETFATSGPRMRVRFFAGYGLGADLLDSPELAAQAYEKGVPMGSDLAAQNGDAPQFLVWASRDAQSATLQRVQIIKGWVGEDGPQEQVFDVACSDELAPDPATHRCPDNGAQVDLSDCSTTEGVGASELKASWQDPNFDATQRAFYYVRVLENPTCRWSTWDAVRAGVEPREDLKKTIQERAWSSPIWYDPS